MSDRKKETSDAIGRLVQKKLARERERIVAEPVEVFNGVYLVDKVDGNTVHLVLHPKHARPGDPPFLVFKDILTQNLVGDDGIKVDFSVGAFIIVTIFKEGGKWVTNFANGAEDKVQ